MTMSQADTAETPGLPPLDRQQLLEVKDRFLRLSKERFHRTCLALQSRQKLFLEVLPIMFHVNHPALPGYVDKDTPSGISNFKPKASQLKRAKEFSRSFRYQPITANNPQILSLFVMGSIGTIGQSRTSDLDFWVCYDPALTEEDVVQLSKRCERITEWAALIGLETCFFPMNGEAFSRGETLSLSAESSGGAQHALLLDEFYRSAVYLAGRYPFWWFVPPGAGKRYDDYVNHLKHQRFLRPNETLDLGGIPEVPKYEFLTAGIWQLYKGISSPYKSVLKLALLETYTQSYPETDLLSEQFKQAVYDDQLDINSLDPYIQIYRQIERYLSSEDNLMRLELIRRCFYFKVNKPLSRKPATTPPSWQRMVLQGLCQEWNWRAVEFSRLDDRKNWKTRSVVDEKNHLVKELNTSYDALKDFFGSFKITDPALNREMTILGRKLDAAFKSREGKIESANPDISKNISEQTVSFSRLGPQHWSLSNGHHSLYSGRSLLEVLVWGCWNQVINRATATRAGQEMQHIPLPAIIRNLGSWLDREVVKPEHSAFFSSARLTNTLIVTNVIHHKIPQLQMSYSSSDTAADPICYGPKQQNLVTDCSLVCVNSWGEIDVFTYESLNSLLEGYLKYCIERRELKPPEPTIECFNPFVADAIQQRLGQLFTDIHQKLLSSNLSARFIFQQDASLTALEINTTSELLLRTEFSGRAALLKYLSKPNSEPTSIHLDNHCLSGDDLQSIFSLNYKAAVRVYIHPRGRECSVYVSDEYNSLHAYRTEYVSSATLMRPLHHFLRTIVNKQQNRADINHSHFGVYPIEFYMIQDVHQGPAESRLQRLPITPEIRDVPFYDIRAKIIIDGEGEQSFSIHCGDHSFSTEEQGDHLFHEVASHILSTRRKQERYPCYITDLDILGSEGTEPLTTLTYMIHKREIEDRINSALLEI